MKWKPFELNSIDFCIGEVIEDVLQKGDRVFPLMTVEGTVFDFLVAEKGMEVEVTPG
jgi:hypothetical protein